MSSNTSNASSSSVAETVDALSRHLSRLVPALVLFDSSSSSSNDNNNNNNDSLDQFLRNPQSASTLSSFAMDANIHALYFIYIHSGNNGIKMSPFLFSILFFYYILIILIITIITITNTNTHSL